MKGIVESFAHKHIADFLQRTSIALLYVSKFNNNKRIKQKKTITQQIGVLSLLAHTN